MNDSTQPKQALLYERPTPLSSTNHRGLKYKSVTDYGFTRDVSTVLLATTEFHLVCKEYPIIFVPGVDESIVPVAALSLAAEGPNVFVDADGKWDGNYIPLFIRRYPFIETTPNNEGASQILIDDAYEGLSKDVEGVELFDDKGEQTEALKGIVQNIGDIHKQFQHSATICKKIKELDLINTIGMKITSKRGDGDPEEINLQGLQVIDEKKLRELSDQDVMELHRLGAFGAIYYHLASLNNFVSLAKKKAENAAATPSKKSSGKKKAGKGKESDTLDDINEDGADDFIRK